jgi:hypothetical protein
LANPPGENFGYKSQQNVQFHVKAQNVPTKISSFRNARSKKILGAYLRSINFFAIRFGVGNKNKKK